MQIFIGADHRGFALKERLKEWLMQEGYEVKDMGAHVLTPGDDYTDYAAAVAFHVAKHPESRGLVLCGSGVGVDVVANKTDGIRCVYAASVAEIKASRNDDDTNVLAIATDFTDIEKAKEFVQIFLQTPFGTSERYERRIEKIDKLEHAN